MFTFIHAPVRLMKIFTVNKNVGEEGERGSIYVLVCMGVAPHRIEWKGLGNVARMTFSHCNLI